MSSYFLVLEEKVELICTVCSYVISQICSSRTRRWFPIWQLLSCPVFIGELDGFVNQICDFKIHMFISENGSLISFSHSFFSGGRGLESSNLNIKGSVSLTKTCSFSSGGVSLLIIAVLFIRRFKHKKIKVEHACLVCAVVTNWMLKVVSLFWFLSLIPSVHMNSSFKSNSPLSTYLFQYFTLFSFLLFFFLCWLSFFPLCHFANFF